MAIKNSIKHIFLDLSDHLSATLKLSTNLMNLESKKENFETFLKTVPSHFFGGIFKTQESPILLIADAKVIYSFSNRILGGDGRIETRPSLLFTESEEFAGKKFMEWFQNSYQEREEDLELLRIETDKKQTLCYFPEQKLKTYTVKCQVNEQDIGPLYFCIPEESKK